MVVCSRERGFAPGPHVHEKYRDVVQPHVESFDTFIRSEMRKAIESIEPLRVKIKDRDDTWNIWVSNPQVLKPGLDGDNKRPVLPRHCREMGTTYKGRLLVFIHVRSESSGQTIRVHKALGGLPIMLQSTHCHLRGRTQAELVRMKEEPNEFGGTFICNGIERVLRLIVQQRRHFIMAVRRPAFKKRGSLYTEFGTVIRCCRPDQSSATVRLHYLEDGNVNFAFTINRAEYFIPVAFLFKAFAEVTDKELFDLMNAGTCTGKAFNRGHASFVADRAEVALSTASRMGCSSQLEVLTHLGKHFRVALPNVLEDDSDYDVRAFLQCQMIPGDVSTSVGERLVQKVLFIHLDTLESKFSLLMLMLHKLYALVNLQCCEDDPDAITHHEVLLPGHLLARIIKDKVEVGMYEMAAQIRRDQERAPHLVQLTDSYLKRMSERFPDVGRRLELFLNTGNLTSRSGLDLPQSNGFTVVAEKLNFFRYLSHFRAVHRGAFFTEMRVTTVRKLRPESFGFLCPVHTPDGTPCGLLNHFTSSCNVVAQSPNSECKVELKKLLVAYGMVPLDLKQPLRMPEYLPVHVDGEVVGYVASAQAPALVQHLRNVKAATLANSKSAVAGIVRDGEIPYHLEACLMPYDRGGPYPGLFLFMESARMVRPVRQVRSGKVEMIGTLEQLNMNIRCPDGKAGGSVGLIFTHEEFGPNSMLSNIASCTPFSDFNQSPRNMYQCQMGKQTMGTPTTVHGHRTDTKMYQLHTPQRPMARTAVYDDLCMDEYAQGTNMVVAVAAYTGYDMEDAMILNRAAVDRGLAHGSLYKTEVVDLSEMKGCSMSFGPEIQRPDIHQKCVQNHVQNPPSDAFGDTLPQNIITVDGQDLEPDSCHKDSDRVDVDGLPKVGVAVWPGQTYVNMLDSDKNNRSRGVYLKGEEVAIVQQVTKLANSRGKAKHSGCARANIKLRLNRNPVIGDKFASRAGQKGVLGQLWPDEDMPFVASTGMRPDLLINPHAFPSRMTIGMLLESMASKAGALRGQFVDASSFQKCSNADSDYAQRPVETVGRMLEANGYMRHGQETMINGLTGEEMPCDIFIGLVYYQRLRHMVKDKFQVRSVGRNNPLTHQPVQGRKSGGGIRFGEMERDSLLAHGAAYLLHDRLHYCSDYHVLDVCACCGSALSLLHKPTPSDRMLNAGMTNVSMGKEDVKGVECSVCGERGEPERVAMPYVLKYLMSELALMHVKVKLDVSSKFPCHN